MKKILATALIATMAVVTLVGCGGNQTSDGGSQTSSSGNKTKTIESDGMAIEGDLGDAVEVVWGWFDDDDIVSSILMQTEAIECFPLEINLADKNGDYVQPNGDVTITIEFEDEFNGNYTVYREESDATFTALAASIVDGKLTFKTSHFSAYILVKTEEAIDLNGDLAKLEIISPEEYYAQMEEIWLAESEQQYQDSISKWPDPSEYQMCELLDGTKLYMSIIDVAEIETLVAESDAIEKWRDNMKNLNASSYNITGFWCNFGQGGSFICGTTSVDDIVKTQQLLDELVTTNGFNAVARWGN